MKFDGNNFARGLRMRMSELNITTTNLSKQTKISRTTITSCRSGKSKMLQFGTLNAFCEALNCTPNDLFKELSK